ncbi:MAG: methyltransferase family protein [Streptosporangiaceae bacterium]
MRRPATAATSLVWFIAIGGTFGCLLPYLLGDWQFHQPLGYWDIARAVGALLICAGLVPVVNSFVDFFKTGGTPVPVASPPWLVVTGLYSYVCNPIYLGFLVILLGQTSLFGSPGLAEYTAIAWCIGAAGIRRGVPGLPARRARLDTAAAPLDSRRARAPARR